MLAMMGGQTVFSMQPAMAIGTDLEEAVSEAAERNVRAVKVVIDARRPRLIAEAELPACGDFAESFEEVLGLLEDAKPCIVLLRVDDRPQDCEAIEADWLLLSWAPEDASPKDKMRYACCKKALREKFQGLRFSELFAEDRGSLTVEAALASCRPLSEEERDALSTREEFYAKLREREHGAGAAAAPPAAGSAPPPRIDYGLRAPPVQTLPSFDEALNSLLAEAGECVVRAQLEVVKDASGTRDGRELAGTVLPDVTLSNGVSGCFEWLPADGACYVVSQLRDERLLLLVWRPEGADPGDKVLYSASRAAVRILVERAAADRDVVVVEAADIEELSESLQNVGAVP